MNNHGKKEFEPCKINVISFENEDVISTSGFDGIEEDLGFGDGYSNTFNENSGDN